MVVIIIQSLIMLGIIVCEITPTLSLRPHPDGRTAEHWSLHRLTFFQCESKISTLVLVFSAVSRINLHVMYVGHVGPALWGKLAMGPTYPMAMGPTCPNTGTFFFRGCHLSLAPYRMKWKLPNNNSGVQLYYVIELVSHAPFVYLWDLIKANSQ